jgi:tetratricopeptide (TPR) repeat protein
MSDPLRTDGTHAQKDASAAADRMANDAKIEQLLLVGLDHYFAARYELAINVWTRALFLDRNHPRARAYIERARSALAERQRESEEMLRNGVAAFDRGESDEARRLLQAAIDGGAPSEEALAVLERMNRLETAVAAPAPAVEEPKVRRRAPRVGAAATTALGGTLVTSAMAIAVLALVGWAAWTSRIDWRSLMAFAQGGVRSDAPAALTAPPVTRDAPLPLPRRGEEALARARSLAASGHLHDALATLDAVRPTDAHRPDADRLRGDIQRQLLALTTLPSVAADREKGERRNP